ncbi:MAG: hypothetical protein ACK58T_22385, partial [Phycisphaerae bacterium]
MQTPFRAAIGKVATVGPNVRDFPSRPRRARILRNREPPPHRRSVKTDYQTARRCQIEAWRPSARLWKSGAAFKAAPRG